MLPPEVTARMAAERSGTDIKRSELTESAITVVDTHGHVFTRDMRMIEGRRYTPAYDATIADYTSATVSAAFTMLSWPNFVRTAECWSLSDEAVGAYMMAIVLPPTMPRRSL